MPRCMSLHRHTSSRVGYEWGPSAARWLLLLALSSHASSSTTFPPRGEHVGGAIWGKFRAEVSRSALPPPPQPWLLALRGGKPGMTKGFLNKKKGGSGPGEGKRWPAGEGKTSKKGVPFEEEQEEETEGSSFDMRTSEETAAGRGRGKRGGIPTGMGGIEEEIGVAFDMRTAEEKAEERERIKIIEKMMAGEKGAEEDEEDEEDEDEDEDSDVPEKKKGKPKWSQRTLDEQKEVRKVLAKLIKDYAPERKDGKPITVDSVMGHWGSVFGEDTVEKQLLHASKDGDVDDVRSMLEHGGAHIEMTNKLGETALIMAADHGQIEVLCFLIKSGAKLDHQTKDGWTALHYATVKGRALVVEILLRAGAHPQIHDYAAKIFCPKRPLEDMGTTPLSLTRQWMDRSGEPGHLLYDARGGDVYYRIQEMLLIFGAKPWLPALPGLPNSGQSIRPMCDDSDLDKELHDVPLSEEEKRRICPELYDEKTLKWKKYMEQGILPNDKRYFPDWVKDSTQEKAVPKEDYSTWRGNQDITAWGEGGEMADDDDVAGRGWTMPWDPDKKKGKKKKKKASHVT